MLSITIFEKSLSSISFNSRPPRRWPENIEQAMTQCDLFQFTTIWEMAASPQGLQLIANAVSIHGHLGDGRAQGKNITKIRY